ncbi:MAG: leucine-rich repeat domain-containing protein, partial [Tannerella sp.]|nr:leucine-rich repeat domain-containing protein [Tannerella sp.]
MAATLSFAQMPLADYLVDNPVMFELVTPSPEAIDFDVAVDGDTVYSGVFVPSGAAPDCEASVSVQDILQPLFRTPELISDTATVSEVANMFLDFSVEFRQGDETLAHAARAYQGGVSKRMLRFLHDMETDIFQYKLKNPRRQFFMTTRTGGNTIVFPENCLTPLFFIAVDRVYTVTTEFGDTYTFPPLETGRVYAFNIEAFRATFANTPCTLTMQLFLTNRVMIRIVPPAPVPDRLVIEFLNSYKMSERMEVTGKCVYAPELDTDGAYDAYDHVTDSYIERNRRQPLRETLHAAFGYKTPDELLFARDMLQSERRFLITPDGERLECRVASDSFQHDVFPVTPQSVPLKITLSDTEENFTPERSPDDDYLERVFIAVLNVPSGRLQNGLPLSGNVDLAIDWGDGTTETVTADYPRHTYAAQGEYVVAVAGHADYFSQTTAFQNLPNQIQANFRYNMRKIESFGDLGIISASNAFRNCSNLNEVEAAPAYFFRNVTDAQSMFEFCTSLHSTLQEIDSSVLTNVSSMYSNCTSLDTVSESLFSKCRNLSGVRYLFNACTSLVNVP